MSAAAQDQIGGSQPSCGRPPAFYFLIIPEEAPQLRKARWDKVLLNLQESGWTILGTGPDLDWPVRYELADENNPFGEFWEIFDVTPLDGYRDLLPEGVIL